MINKLKKLLQQPSIIIFDSSIEGAKELVHSLSDDNLIIYERTDIKKEIKNITQVITIGFPPEKADEMEYIDAIEPQYIYWIDIDTKAINKIEYKSYNGDLGSIKLPFSFLMQTIERAFLFELAKHSKSDALIFEIGRNSGGSTLALSLGNNTKKEPSLMISIDIIHNKHYDYFAEKYHIADSIECVTFDSSKFDLPKKAFEMDIKTTIGLLWVDGDHSYKGCKSDLQRYKGYVISGGIIAVHDYGSSDPSLVGIMQAIEEELIQDDDYENFCVVGSIFFAQKKGSHPIINVKNLNSEVATPKYVFEYLTKNHSCFTNNTALYGASFQAIDIIQMAKEAGISHKIIALIDDNKANDNVCGIDIISLDEVKEKGVNHIILSSYNYEEEMAQKLLTKGYKEDMFTRIYTDKNFKSFIDKRMRTVYRFDSMQWQELFTQ